MGQIVLSKMYCGILTYYCYFLQVPVEKCSDERDAIVETRGHGQGEGDVRIIH
jgi:hypothetical protein